MQQLGDGWQFRQSGEPEWRPATVPGCVHTDLLANGLIEDPFDRDNERRQQWISDQDWLYRVEFDVAAQLFQQQYIEVLFEGLDTHSKVFLNGNLILEADNMFRAWRVDVKSLLRESANELLIEFCSPLAREKELTVDQKPLQPAVNDQSRGTSPHSRKAPYHYGWDWGPCLITSGLWRPVKLEGWSKLRILDSKIEQKELNDSHASLTLTLDIETAEALSAGVTVAVSGDVAATIEDRPLSVGRNQLSVDFRIDAPKRWWPAGMGEQHLYNIKIVLATEDERLMVQKRIGLRTVEVRRDPDSEGESFCFVVNDVPVFAKGANWVPADSFTTRITDAHYRHLLESARDANMNMIRVWGGGIYEPAIFYETCDELGLMVWQDFMFACSMYPAGESFLESVEHEARHQLRRLRHHPSIVLWCGNNEIEIAWHTWGWKQEFPESFWEDYQALFHDVLERVCGEEEPSRLYWPSSPSSSTDLSQLPQDENRGDVHYWGVWHGKEPFEAYEEHRCRFMSEYGFQSFPELKTVQSYTIESDHDILSDVMRAHQRNGSGNEKIKYYMTQYYNIPQEFSSFLILSQIQQAHGIKAGAEFLRRSMPYCMGSLYWQLNDCWPVASWSSIDSFGRWKALQYYARRFYAPLLVSPHRRDKRALDLYVVSDRREALGGELQWRLVGLDGTTISSGNQEIDVEPLNSRVYHTLDLSEITGKDVIAQSLLHCAFVQNGRAVSENTLYFSRAKDQLLQQPELAVSVQEADGDLLVNLEAGSVVRDAYLSADKYDGFFEDNFLDLLPGSSRVVRFRPSGGVSASELQAALRVVSLRELMG